MHTHNVRRAASSVSALLTALALGACSNLLEVQYPGRIPSGQIGDPGLAAVLVRGAVGDLECAYSNYMSGSSVHSDEYETSNSNVPLANWGERTITADETDYVISPCDNNLGNFGIQVPLHTARFQSEDVYNRLSGWTDAQVPNRASLMATVRAYGGYAYTFMGEGFCEVSFDGGARQPPSAALIIAEQRFTEAVTLAGQAGNADIQNLARVGLARARLDLKKWADAATAAAAVTPGYVKLADRGQETSRRWNDLYRLAEQQGAYTVACAFRPTHASLGPLDAPCGTTPALDDPRTLVIDAGRGAFNSEVRLWVTRKYSALISPQRLASYKEAQLILAEAQAQQGQVGAAEATINAYRDGYGLPHLTFADQADAIAKIIEERRRELSFEGGHRLNDLLRYGKQWKVGQNPFTNRAYGATTCWPYPTRESNGV
jgi:hypothetical protein